MKKLLLLFSVALLTIGSASAQCTPDPQYTTPGIYPDSATGFSAGCVGDLYDQLITNVVPVDTTVEIIPGFPTTLDFDSIVIVSFTGLPASLSYACNDVQNIFSPADQCAFEGGTTGCVSISGTPVLADVGTHNLVITVDVYVGGLGTSSSTQIIDWYFIEILPAGSCTGGINESLTSKVNAYPNPTENTLTVDGLDANTQSIVITNYNGQVVQSYSEVNSESFKMDVQHLESGMYFVRVNSTTESEVIRFIKK